MYSKLNVYSSACEKKCRWCKILGYSSVETSIQSGAAIHREITSCSHLFSNHTPIQHGGIQLVPWEMRHERSASNFKHHHYLFWNLSEALEASSIFEGNEIIGTLIISEKDSLQSLLILSDAFFSKIGIYPLPYQFDETLPAPSEIHETIKKLKCEHNALIGPPLGHDVLDLRFVDHLNWLFKPQWSKIFINKPVISIVIPCYNRAELLPKVVSALMGQTLPADKFEILIIDDASSDGSCNYLEGLNISNLSWCQLPPRQRKFHDYIENRAGPARNAGIEKSRGEIILFLDADIILPCDYLEKIILEHKDYDLLLPIRRFLSKEATNLPIFPDIIDQSLLMGPAWSARLDPFYSGDWNEFESQWEYFMSYSLSIKKHLVDKVGPFRTSYISYGYEDMDLGIRVLSPEVTKKRLDLEVFHLYHFDGEAEYTLNTEERIFQLAFTARNFYYQNFPIQDDRFSKTIPPRKIDFNKIYSRYKALWNFPVNENDVP